MNFIQCLAVYMQVHQCFLLRFRYLVNLKVYIYNSLMKRHPGKKKKVERKFKSQTQGISLPTWACR